MPTDNPKDSCMCDYLATHPWINEHSMCPENTVEKVSLFQNVLFIVLFSVSVMVVIGVISAILVALL